MWKQYVVGACLILTMLSYPAFADVRPTQERETFPDRPVLSVRLYWDVIGFVGDNARFDAQQFLGKRQNFYKVYSHGPFLNCERTAASFNKVSKEDFFNSFTFSWWEKYNDILNIDGKHLYIEELACPESMTALYPFVTASNSDWAYIPFDGVIFILKGAPQVPLDIGPSDG